MLMTDILNKKGVLPPLKSQYFHMDNNFIAGFVSRLPQSLLSTTEN